MPKREYPVPKYRKHKASKQAVVRLAGRMYYLGLYGSKESKTEYQRRIAEWNAQGRPRAGCDITVAELVELHSDFAERHYRRDGVPTGEAGHFHYALLPVLDLYGETEAAHFGPLALEVVQNHFIEKGLARTEINHRIARIKRVFRWAKKKDLIPAETLTGLDAFDGLRRGRTEAKESKPVRPVSDEVVEKTLPALTRVIAAMVRFQQLTGCRPGEVCSLRPCDVDQGGDVWLYQPEQHKNAYRGQRRTIFIGPIAQEVLQPFMFRDAARHCFSPADNEEHRRRLAHALRITPLSCGNKPGSNRKPGAKRTLRDFYVTHSYSNAVRRRSCANKRTIGGAVAAGLDPKQAVLIPHWHPNQLRHAAATKLRAKYGAEMAGTVLGHANLNTTEIYAEADLARARAIAKEVG